MSKSKRRVSVLLMLAVNAVLACGVVSTATAAEEKTGAKEAQATAEREQRLEEARKRLDEAAREVAELSMSLSEEAMPDLIHMSQRMASRAMLGVNIGSGGDEKRKDGVEILSVSPGGPAAEAGLKAGDVIVEIDNKSLKEKDGSSPRKQLLAAMREVEPEEKVSVRYLRDGKSATATVVARPVARRMARMIHPGPGMRMERMPFMFMRGGGVFGSAELATVTPKLGQYFGTDKGLLVVRAPSDSALKLEEGDVIVDIGGRVPSSPSHAWRILESYQPGEQLKLNVLRMKKRVTVDLTIPEGAWERRFETLDGPEGDVLIPAPPAPPVMPAPAPGARNDTA